MVKILIARRSFLKVSRLGDILSIFWWFKSKFSKLKLKKKNYSSVRHSDLDVGHFLCNEIDIQMSAGRRLGIFHSIIGFVPSSCQRLDNGSSHRHVFHVPVAVSFLFFSFFFSFLGYVGPEEKYWLFPRRFNWCEPERFECRFVGRRLVGWQAQQFSISQWMPSHCHVLLVIF